MSSANSANETAVRDAYRCMDVFDDRLPPELRTSARMMVGTADMVLWVTPEGKFAFANPAALNRLGYSATELSELTIPDINPDVPSVDVFRSRYWSGLQRHSQRIYRLHHRDKAGSVYPVEIAAHLAVHEQFEVAFSIVRDMTEHDRVVDELEKLSQFRGDVLGVLGSIQGHWHLNVDSGAISIAPGVMRLLELNPDQTGIFEGGIDDLVQMIDAKDRTTFLKWVRLCGAGQKIVEGDCRMVKGNGRRLWVRHRMGISKNDEALTIVGTIHDIDRAKRGAAERRHLFDALVDRYAIGDLDSNRWESLSTTWPSEDKPANGKTRGMPLEEMFAESDHDRARHCFDTLRNRSGVTESTLLTRTSKGEVALRWDFVRPHPDEPRFFALMRKDFDGRQNVLAAIADAVPSTLYVYDVAKGRNVFVNQSIGETLGYTPAEVAGMGSGLMAEILHPDDSATVQQHHRRVATSTTSQTHEVEYRLRHRDGRYRLMHSCDRVFERDNSGQVQTIVGTATLLDDLETLKRYSTELERVNQELEQFVYVASHDLRQPLRGINNLAGFLEEDCADLLPGESRGHLESIRGRIERMENLLSDLLEFSRVGRSKIAIESFELRSIVDDATELLGADPQYSVLTEGDFGEVTTYRVPLQQIVRNLIGNAYKHRTRDNGHVIVRGTIDADSIRIEFEDNGPGIEPQFRERVFKMFQTLRVRDQVEGSGMGLALCEKWATVFGGKIEIDDYGPPGCRFVVTWPQKPLANQSVADNA